MERSKPIDIIYGKLPYTQGKNTPDHYDEYSLKQNCFDPSKNSPPNAFVSKLKSRINSYYTISLSSSPPASFCFFKKNKILSKQ
jgi:hypothetical protein